MEGYKKKSYDFIMKAGPKFQEAVFKLCKRMIEEEEFADRFEETILNQLYKVKGRLGK